MKLSFCFFAILTGISSIALSQQVPTNTEKIDVEYLLKSLVDLSSLPSYEQGTYSAQESSYDRTGMNDDGFGGTYSFVRRNADSTLVLFDQKGPGVVNRIWTPTPTNDTLDFYIDNESVPTFSVMYRDLFSGKKFPFIAPLCANQLGGYYCYLPIPFAKSCKIVLRGKATRFHQIGYRRYPAGTTVESFRLPLKKSALAVLDNIISAWGKSLINIEDLNSRKGSMKEFRQSVSIKPGQSVMIFNSPGAGRIAGFELNTSAPIDTLARSLDIRITWDGEQIPAVYCPLADYFGYAFGKSSMMGLVVGSDGRRHYSWFPMPFDRSAKVELIYRASSTRKLNPIGIETKFYFDPRKRDVKSEGKFYAHWNRENPVAAGKAFTMLNVKGKGHFAGVALQSQGLLTGITSFFEGDDSTVVDGELRMHGTGSEDFFNGGWYALLDCWDDAMSLPLSGSLDYSIPLCRTGGYRFFLSDKISFDRSLFQSIEHGPEFNQVPSDYTSVSYFYCDRNNAQSVNPSNANTGIYVPDTLEIYPQLMFTAMDESITADARWAGTPAKTMYYTVAGNALLKMSMQDIPPGEYDVYFDYRKSKEGANFSIWQRQTQISEWIDGYADEEKRFPMEKICHVRLTQLNNSISFRFKTMEGRNRFILTRMILIRKG